MTEHNLRVAIVGGGAAGFFGAIACAEANPEAAVHLYEATQHVLSKVRISGGGRCNTTHACFEPRELAKRYPRGSRELIGPFSRFGPRQTVEWFAARGVELKTEPDGRMFPTTDDSETIVSCLVGAAERAGVRIHTRCGVRTAHRTGDRGFRLELTDGSQMSVDRLLVATGGTRGSGGHEIAAALGHTIEPPVPSLFTFNLADERLRGLEGLATKATVSVPQTRLTETGPVLVTHWGLSGPAILRLSAWGARELAGREYRFALKVDWTAGLAPQRVLSDLQAWRSLNPRKQIAGSHPFEVPSRLWERLVAAARISESAPWTSISNASLQALTDQLTAGAYAVEGKSTNKDEFVTCGGVKLSEVNFQTLESRLCPGLAFAGEVLDIDGITGGFNFQAAWTTAWIAGQSVAR